MVMCGGEKHVKGGTFCVLNASCPHAWLLFSHGFFASHMMERGTTRSLVGD